MKTYWDYTENERAELTYDDLQELRKYEMMEAGLLNPAPPELRDETPPPIATRKFYKVTYGCDSYTKDVPFEVLFKTAEDAEAFIRLSPAAVGSDWQIRGDFYKEVSGYQVQVVELPTEEDRVAHKPRLIELSTIKDTNKKLKDEYDKAVRDAEEACKSMYSDYDKVTSKGRKYRHIIDTWKTYLRDCDDNQDIALRFMLKAVSQEDFIDACEWCGVPCPVPNVTATCELLDEPL